MYMVNYSIGETKPINKTLWAKLDSNTRIFIVIYQSGILIH